MPVLDPHVLAVLRDLSPSGLLLAETASTFAEDAPVLFASIHAAARDGEGERAAAAAHSLRGLSLHLGALELAAACAELERLAARGCVSPDAVSGLRLLVVSAVADACRLAATPLEPNEPEGQPR